MKILCQLILQAATLLFRNKRDIVLENLALRQQLAIQYLRESHRSVGEITYLLGFSEPSNFTRAFRRWTGKSPVEYRDNAGPA